MAIVIALGSNIGPGRETLELACIHLQRIGVEVMRRSRLYHTRPWGVTGQRAFINAAITVRTPLRPHELLARCHQVERTLGRRRVIRWGPRRIDLDLLLYQAVRVDTPQLMLPHPQIPLRDFVLAPLLDLGVPPLHPIAPHGWAALLHAIPVKERSILHVQDW